MTKKAMPSDLNGNMNPKANKKTRAVMLYLAYHEGRGSYQRKSYLNKVGLGLKRVADKVAYRARLFQSQLDACKMN